MAIIDSQHFGQFLNWLFEEMPRANPRIANLPKEVRAQIFSHIYINDSRKRKRSMELLPISRAYTAPANGSSPFMTLPTELRRQIFHESLPGRDVHLRPKCISDVATQLSQSGMQSEKPRRNKVSDLMILNSTITNEIAEMVYEERFFVIHVHEGLANGGVEFLNAGRQPLQYLNLDMLEDDRFVKFGQNQFSFRRLKKIIVQIHPTSEDYIRHTAINTHFIIKALCHLLDRSDHKKTRITRLEVEFPKLSGGTRPLAGRRAIQKEQYWWDPDTKKPRATNFHGISDIELVLRPFEMLPCHSVSICLPEGVCRHQPTVDFVSSLVRQMESADSMMRFADDDLEMKLEVLRKEMEEYVTYTVHGKGHHEVVDLIDKEINEEEDDDADESDFSIDDEGALEYNKLNMSLGQTIGEQRSEQRAMFASIRSAEAEEARLLQEALAASLKDFDSNTSSGPEVVPRSQSSKGSTLRATALPFQPRLAVDQGNVIDLTSSDHETDVIDLSSSEVKSSPTWRW